MIPPKPFSSRKFLAGTKFLPSDEPLTMKCNMTCFGPPTSPLIWPATRIQDPQTHHQQIDLGGGLGVCDVNGMNAHQRYRYLEDDIPAGLLVPSPLRIIDGVAGLGPLSPVENWMGIIAAETRA